MNQKLYVHIIPCTLMEKYVQSIDECTEVRVQEETCTELYMDDVR